MVKVENKETLRLLTRQFMKANRGRNLIAVISVILTTLLFTSVFTCTVSLVLSDRATQIRRSADSAHAAAFTLTREEAQRAADAASRSVDVTRWGQGIFVGLISDARLSVQGEVGYADPNMAECRNTVPAVGTLPQNSNEIAVSTLILDSLNIPRNLGEEITLDIEVNAVTGETRTDTFVLSGYWEGDQALTSQMAWVSENYARQAVDVPGEEELEQGQTNGARSLCVWYENTWNLKEKTKELAKQAQLPSGERALLENAAYNLFEEDAFSFPSFISMTLLVILSGYLIICNVFSISVQTDIRIYGLLKNVGTTGRQLKRIVRMQAWRLACAGIPIGLLAGYLLGNFLLPCILADVIPEEGQVIQRTSNPWILIWAALFSLFTVYIASRKACKKVEKVSPVEALRMEGGNPGKRKKGKSIPVTWWGMAAANVGREKGRGIIVMISIALSLITLNCVALLVSGYHLKEFTDIYLDCDIRVSQVGHTLHSANFQGVNEEVKEILDICPYSANTAYVYYSEESHRMEPDLEAAFRKIYDDNQANMSEYVRSVWQETFEQGQVRIHYMGLNQDAFERLEWESQPCTWEEFQTGDWVLLDGSDRYVVDPETPYYKTGDVFEMTFKNGKEKEYQVRGQAALPYSLDYPYTDLVYLTVLVPEQEYIRYTGQSGAMFAAVDAIEGLERQTKEYMDRELSASHRMLRVDSLLEMQEGFSKYLDKFYIVGGLLAAVLAMIGIMNFFNMSATSVLTRRRELAMLETVGMTREQIRKMLVGEGCIYLFGAFVLAIAVVLLFAEKLIAHTVGKAFFFHMRMTVAPCILMLPVLLLIACCVPEYHLRRMEKKSLVERMKSGEAG